MTRFFLILMFVAMATGMFVIKNRVIGLEKELASVNAQIESDQKAIHVLKAEWTYLTDPHRIRVLSERFAQMKPIKGSQIKSISALPLKNGQTATGVIRVSYAPAAKRE